MYRVAVMYPNEEGAKFDHDYYKGPHMELVAKHMKSYGLIKYEADKGLSGGGDAPAPYIGIGYLYFETQDGYEKGIAEHGATLRGDIPNFTNVRPTRQISEVL